MRLKYSNELRFIWYNYYEAKNSYESVMKKTDDLETLKLFEQFEKKKYDSAVLVFPTINLLHNLTTSWCFRTAYSNSILSKNEMLNATTKIKSDLEKKIIDMQNLYDIDKRIKKGEDPHRVQQIKSVRKTIRDYKKQIESLEWYEDLIKNTNIIEEKTLRMMEEDNGYKRKENV